MINLKQTIINIFIYLLLFLLLLITIIPFCLVIINSTHSSYNIVTQLNLWFGDKLKNNYNTLQSNINIWQGFLNSLVVSVPFTDRKSVV